MTKEIDIPVNVKECVKAIKEAIKMFGEYSYYDKQVSEVIDLIIFVERFKMMSAKDIADVLNDVAKIKHGERFVCGVILELQDLPDDKWEELMSYYNLEQYY